MHGNLIQPKKLTENDAVDSKNNCHRRRTTAKRLSTASSVADKTGLLTGVIAGLLATSGISPIAGISLTSCGASCSIVSPILALIQKRYSSSGKIYHMIYTSAAELVALLQRGLSQALTDREFSADEFKLLKFIFIDFLLFVNLEIQKMPGDGVDFQEKS